MKQGLNYGNRPLRLYNGTHPRTLAERAVAAMRATATQRRLKREFLERQGRRAA